MAGGHVGGRGAAPIKRFAPGDGVEGPAAFGAAPTVLPTRRVGANNGRRPLLVH